VELISVNRERNQITVLEIGGRPRTYVVTPRAAGALGALRRGDALVLVVRAREDKSTTSTVARIELAGSRGSGHGHSS